MRSEPAPVATEASDYFFNGGKFSNQTMLVGMGARSHPADCQCAAGELFRRQGPPAPDWPDDDYDTIWTVTLDANGNLTVDNALCEGIESAALPATPPEF